MSNIKHYKPLSEPANHFGASLLYAVDATIASSIAVAVMHDEPELVITEIVEQLLLLNRSGKFRLQSKKERLMGIEGLAAPRPDPVEMARATANEVERNPPTEAVINEAMRMQPAQLADARRIINEAAINGMGQLWPNVTEWPAGYAAPEPVADGWSQAAIDATRLTIERLAAEQEATPVNPCATFGHHQWSYNLQRRIYVCERCGEQMSRAASREFRATQTAQDAAPRRRIPGEYVMPARRIEPRAEVERQYGRIDIAAASQPPQGIEFAAPTPSCAPGHHNWAHDAVSHQDVCQSCGRHRVTIHDGRHPARRPSATMTPVEPQPQQPVARPAADDITDITPW